MKWHKSLQDQKAAGSPVLWYSKLPIRATLMIHNQCLHRQALNLATLAFSEILEFDTRRNRTCIIAVVSEWLTNQANEVINRYLTRRYPISKFIQSTKLILDDAQRILSFRDWINLISGILPLRRISVLSYTYQKMSVNRNLRPTSMSTAVYFLSYTGI